MALKTTKIKKPIKKKKSKEVEIRTVEAELLSDDDNSISEPEPEGTGEDFIEADSENLSLPAPTIEKSIARSHDPLTLYLTEIRKQKTVFLRTTLVF